MDLMADEFFKKRFLGQADFSEEPEDFEVTDIQKMNVARDDQPPEFKPAMFISGHDRPLPLNKTNCDTMWIALGKRLKDWIGHRVSIWVDPTVSFAGERKGGVRLRVVSKPANRPAVRSALATKLATTRAAAAARAAPPADALADIATMDDDCRTKLSKRAASSK